MNVGWVGLGVALFDLAVLVAVAVVFVRLASKVTPHLASLRPMLAMFGPVPAAAGTDDVRSSPAAAVTVTVNGDDPILRHGYTYSADNVCQVCGLPFDASVHDVDSGDSARSVYQ